MTSEQESDLTTIDDCWNRIGVWSREESRCPELERYVHCRNCPTFARAGRHVLESRVADDYMREWADIYAQNKQTRAIDNRSVVIFRIGDEWFALPTKKIREISELREIHTIPHTLSKGSTCVLRGLVNVDGELKLCVSLGNLLALDKGTLTNNRVINISHQRMIVASYEGGDFVFPVSEVTGTYRFHEDEMRAAPATIGQAKGTYTEGMVEYNGKQIACLDDELLFYSLERGLA